MRRALKPCGAHRTIDPNLNQRNAFNLLGRIKELPTNPQGRGLMATAVNVRTHPDFTIDEIIEYTECFVPSPIYKENMRLTHLLTAGRSAGSPYVKPDDLAAVVGYLDRRPVGRGPFEVGRLRARLAPPMARIEWAGERGHDASAAFRPRVCQPLEGGRCGRCGRRT
jgi:hypothetical protein